MTSHGETIEALAVAALAVLVIGHVGCQRPDGDEPPRHTVVLGNSSRPASAPEHDYSKGPLVLEGRTGSPAVIEGRPRVVDGDSLVVSGVSVRLFGVDAFELAQRCHDRSGASYACGARARDALVRTIGSLSVRCTRQDTDHYGRMVAVCTSAATDLAAAQARAGWATAYRYFSKRYVDDENAARDAEAGAWSGRFENPRDWRRANPRR